MCCALAALVSDYTQKEIINCGQSLPTTVHDPVIIFMGDIHMMIKSGMRTNSISTFDRPPPSYQFFKESIETNQHASQHVTQNTRKPVNRGGNQDGTTRARVRNPNDPYPTSQMTQVGCDSLNQMPNQHVSLVSPMEITYEINTPPSDTHAQNITTLARKTFTFTMKT